MKLDNYNIKMDDNEEVLIDRHNRKYRSRSFSSIPASLNNSLNNSLQNVLSLQKLPPQYPPAYLTYPGSSTASSRSLLSAYQRNKRCGTTSCACRIAVVIIVVLLIIWGITVPLYFFVGPGKAELQRAAEVEVMSNFPEAQASRSTHIFAPKAKDHHAVKESLMTNGTVLTSINCSVRIVNQLFTSELEDHNSAHYQTLKLKLETLLTIVFQGEKSFQKAIVSRFRLGTVVEFIVILNEKRIDIRDYVRDKITDYLLKNWLMLGVFQIDITTLTINYVYDPCYLKNGGCSHHCYWSIMRGSEAICQCPEDYYLSTDGMTCHHIVLLVVGKEPVSKEEHCKSDQFHCHSNGNCIPDTWICDGVSDCLRDEDELVPNCKSSSITGLTTELDIRDEDSKEKGIIGLDYNGMDSFSDIEMQENNNHQEVYPSTHELHSQFEPSKARKEDIISENMSVVKYNGDESSVFNKDLIIWDNKNN